VAEHDLLLSRLAEDAHVRDGTVCREEARACGVAAVLAPDEVGVPLCLLDLTRDAGDHDVAAQPYAGVA
jgi:hypothetical protein